MIYRKEAPDVLKWDGHQETRQQLWRLGHILDRIEFQIVGDNEQPIVSEKTKINSVW
jgi:hypothetical protein